jgi:hypothetical protein
MGTITKKIIKLIEGREGILPDEIKEHLIELKEEIKNLEKHESDLINRMLMTQSVIITDNSESNKYNNTY